MIRFLHGHDEVALEDMAAATTILDYLREHRGLVGTKEGCASGDCGACTVVTARATDAGLEYEPLNACIAALGSLHGKQLITVEDLKDGETWHPVQRAMIEHHASQCGFCTPGFVMSLFALYHRAGAVSRDALLEALGGNLCRCTGYRPIIAAAEDLLGQSRADHFSRCAQATLDRLRALEGTERKPSALERRDSHYFRPASADAAAALLAQHPDARLLAGGTDLFLEVTQTLDHLPVLIDLRAVPELGVIGSDNNAITLGAAVTHRASQKPVLADYPELTELIERFGSLQIRSQGTVVGNIANASPIGDWPPVLLALGAQLTLQSANAQRRLPVDEFFLGYRETALQSAEFVRAVSIPRRDPQLFLRAYKISKRFEDDISSLCAVFALRMDGDRIVSARVACGGMAAVPMRGTGCETALTGLDLRADSVDAAQTALREDFSPISDARASATYRSMALGNLLLRLQREFLGEHRVRAHLPGAEHA